MQQGKVCAAWIAVAILVGWNANGGVAQETEATPSPANATSASIIIPALGPEDLPQIRHAWYELPPWAEGLPFDIETGLAIQPQQNREPLYFQSFAEMQPNDFWRYFERYSAIDARRFYDATRTISEQLQQAQDFVSDRWQIEGFVAPFSTKSIWRHTEPVECRWTLRL